MDLKVYEFANRHLDILNELIFFVYTCIYYALQEHIKWIEFNMNAYYIAISKKKFMEKRNSFWSYPSLLVGISVNFENEASRQLYKVGISKYIG